MKFLPDTGALFSAAELGEAIGADPETVKNWVRREVIIRAPIGGRRLRHRLFSTEEVYKAALTHELVKLGLPPSTASEAVEELWKEWHKKGFPDGKNTFAIISTLSGMWTALLCWQKISGGALYKIGRSSEEIEFPKTAFAVLPISVVFAQVAEKLADLLNDKKKRRAKNEVAS